MAFRTNLPTGLVTFLFTDIEGSTRLAQMLGTGYRPVLFEHRRLLRSTLSEHDGAPLGSEGDSLFVAFPDAARALEACAEAQRVLTTHAWPAPSARPLVRMGLHTGLAQPHAGEYASPEVHRAARVAAAAHGGQVLCSGATARQAGQAIATVPIDRTRSWSPGRVDVRSEHEMWLLDLGLHRLRGFDDHERLFQLVAPGLARQFPRPRTLGPVPHNLPAQATSFVGRVEEQRNLSGLLDAYRLVTVVGPGGAGKTRLAVQTAASRVESYPDGVWFVDLAAVTDPALVAVRVATALGLRPEPGRAVAETIAEYSADRRFLLVLDTCDAQPSATGGVVARLLAGGPGAAVLATSREPLDLPGEAVWRIPPLRISPTSANGPSEAVALLLERARAATATTPGGAGPAVVRGPDLHELSRIASRLDGLPLALELAASRLRVLSPGDLANRLDDVLGTLDAGHAHPDAAPDVAAAAHGRHSTMQATVGWSYRTLGPDAARLLRWMSVFADRVDLPTVESLAPDSLDNLAVLVDKSLVQAEPTESGMTYRMLDTIRAYAARRLAEEGEEAAARDRHVRWALAAITRAHLGPDGRPVTLSMYSLDPLADELRAALRWSASGGDARQGLLIAGGLDQWWRERGLAREGRIWLYRLYERIELTGVAVPAAELATAYHMHSLHAGADGEHAEELRFSLRAEKAARQANSPGLIARVLAGRGAPLLDLDRPVEAERALRDAIEFGARCGVAADALFAVFGLAQLLWHRGELDEAADLLAGARAAEASRAAERGRRTVDMILGMVALARGDVVAAHEHLIVALRSRIGYGFHSRAVETICALAARCTLTGDHVGGTRLFGAAQAARSRLHCSAGTYVGFWATQQQRLREELGDHAFDAAYAQGAALSLDEAAAAALAIEHPDLSSAVRFDTGDIRSDLGSSDVRSRAS